MSRILAIANQKGGVGKTTTAVNLAASLAELGQRVLLADLDPQGNATMGAGIEKRTALPTVYQILLNQVSVREARMRSAPGHFDVIPANRELAGAEIDLVNLEQRDLRLKVALAQVADDYDFILMDCPPTLNLLTVNAFASAQSVLIPMQCEYYALEGLTDLVATIKKVKQRLNPSIEIEGLLRVMFDPRSTLAQQVSDQIKQHFGNKVYDTVIPRNVRLAEAPSHGLPVLAYDRQCKGAKAYMELAEETLRRAGITVGRQHNGQTQGTRARARCVARRGRQRRAAARRSAHDEGRAAGARQISAAYPDGQRVAAGTRRFHPRAGSDAADPGT